MYKAINRFIEQNHNDHIYEVGDTYPVEGQKLVKKRADELTKVHPQYKVAFLQVVEEKDVKTPAATSSTVDDKVGEAK
ncbi:hypothetical protein MKX79_14915 [Viridibacillus sp. FSL R5-0468]|uniref:hypothetical protein n=1 Tax=Viridibacillus sp. FSL R5-0468 TaxID=2921640 RepID=UPI0030F5617E